MALRAALDQLIIVQKAVAIKSPVTTSVKKAWKYIPRENADLGETPAFFNTFTLAGWEKAISLGIEQWRVNTFLVVYDANHDRAADIVLALLEQYMTDLVSESALTGTVTGWTLRGTDPTLVAIPRPNRDYAGANLIMDVEIKTARQWS